MNGKYMEGSGQGIILRNYPDIAWRAEANHETFQS
jgi:hypothetical protein